MSVVQPAILVTGVSGNIGSRLVPLLTSDFDVIGVDLRPFSTSGLARFEAVDLGKEPSCEQLVRLLAETRASVVVHLAFMTDPHREGAFDIEKMWRVNVLGTARVMEAIAETNRHRPTVRKFICPLSATLYGPDTPVFINEDYALNAHTLASAVHAQEADAVVRYRSDTLGDCSTYLLRTSTVTGATVRNYAIDAMRGVPLGSGAWAERMRRGNKRLPFVTDMAKQSTERQLQFVHVDDVARLIAGIASRDHADPQLSVMNVSGRGEPVTFAQVAEISGAKIVRLPRWVARQLLGLLVKFKVAEIPVESLPYLLGSCTLDTTRLGTFLGSDYKRIFQYSVRDALADTFKSESSIEQTVEL